MVWFLLGIAFYYDYYCLKPKLCINLNFTGLISIKLSYTGCSYIRLHGGLDTIKQQLGYAYQIQVWCIDIHVHLIKLSWMVIQERTRVSDLTTLRWPPLWCKFKIIYAKWTTTSIFPHRDIHIDLSEIGPKMVQKVCFKLLR